MRDERITADVARSRPGRCFELFVYNEERSKQKLSILTDAVFKEVEDGLLFEPSPLRLDETAAQNLMDSLWDSGVRPTAGAGSAGAMRAVENHLNDMRAIVFEKLKIKGN